MTPVVVKLAGRYYLLVVFFCLMWGLGIILYFLNNRVFPKIIDDEGITTRSGRRHLWSDLVDWERQRLVLGHKGGPRITGNLTLKFTTGAVRIGSFPIENLDEVLVAVGRHLGVPITAG